MYFCEIGSARIQYPFLEGVQSAWLSVESRVYKDSDSEWREWAHLRARVLNTYERSRIFSMNSENYTVEMVSGSYVEITDPCDE